MAGGPRGRGRRLPDRLALRPGAQPLRCTQLRGHPGRAAGLPRRTTVAASRPERDQPALRLHPGEVRTAVVRPPLDGLRTGRGGRGRVPGHRVGAGPDPPPRRAVVLVAAVACHAVASAAGRTAARRLLPEPHPRRRLDVRVLRRPGAGDALRAQPHQVRTIHLRGRRQRRGVPQSRHQRTARIHLGVRPVLRAGRGRRHTGRVSTGRGEPEHRYRRRQPQRHRRGGHRRDQSVRRPWLGHRRPARSPGHPVDLQRSHAAEPRLLLPVHDHRCGPAHRRRPGLLRPALAPGARTG